MARRTAVNDSSGDGGRHPAAETQRAILPDNVDARDKKVAALGPTQLLAHFDHICGVANMQRRCVSGQGADTETKGTKWSDGEGGRKRVRRKQSSTAGSAQPLRRGLGKTAAAFDVSALLSAGAFRTLAVPEDERIKQDSTVVYGVWIIRSSMLRQREATGQKPRATPTKPPAQSHETPSFPLPTRTGGGGGAGRTDPIRHNHSGRDTRSAGHKTGEVGVPLAPLGRRRHGTFGTSGEELHDVDQALEMRFRRLRRYPARALEQRSA